MMKILTPVARAIITSLIIAAIYVFSEYDNLSWRLAWGVGLFTLPFVFRLPGKERSYRYLWLSLLLMGSLLFVRSSTIFYFAASTLLLFFWEFNLGKKSFLPLFLLVVISPFIGNMAYIWSFPIRLQLSKWATMALSFIGFEAEAAGNIILLNGQEFAVDPACMGLQMLITSLVLAIFIMARTAYQSQRQYHFLAISISLLTMLFLAIGANFIRLLALIVFQILPGNPLHDIVGLLSLGIYALLPFYWGWSGWYTTINLEKKKFSNVLPEAKRWHLGFYIGLLSFLLLIGLQFRKPAAVDKHDLEEFRVADYQTQFGEYGVLQLTKDNALVYVKPPVRAFQGGHDPRICWQGSGYEFTQIDTLQLGDHIIYQAVLKKEEDTLYTAWWYDSGTLKTVNEWEWRWATISQEHHFYLVNVTASSQNELGTLVASWLKTKLPFSP